MSNYWCVFLVRVSLSDRPGALGQVATALGTVGADIQAVEIVGREEDRVIDDFMVKLPGDVMPDTVVSVCNEIPDVKVLWFSRYPAGAGLESDIEALERMVGDPEHAAAILTEAAPDVFHCHWSVLITKTKMSVLCSTPMAPDLNAEQLATIGPFDFSYAKDLPAGWVPGWPETTVVIAPVRGQRAVIIGRQGGPAFLSAEIARLRHLAALVPMA